MRSYLVVSLDVGIRQVQNFLGFESSLGLLGRVDGLRFVKFGNVEAPSTHPL